VRRESTYPLSVFFRLLLLAPGAALTAVSRFAPAARQLQIGEVDAGHPHSFNNGGKLQPEGAADIEADSSCQRSKRNSKGICLAWLCRDQLQGMWLGQMEQLLQECGCGPELLAACL
jgi:hypothetical protein